VFKRDDEHAQDIRCSTAPLAAGDVAFVAFLRDLGGMPRCCTGGAAAAVWAGLAEGVTGHVGTAVRRSRSTALHCTGSRRGPHNR
jgi:hypothetical protein